MKKHLKRIIAFALMGALTTSVFVGCGKKDENKEGGEASSDEVVELTYNAWGAADEDAVMKKLIAAFEEANPNIKVKYNHIPDDYSNKMNTVLASGAAPDVFLCSDGDFGKWVTAGLIMNIQDKVENSGIDLDDMWDSALGRYKYDGKLLGQGDLYALPKDIGPTVLYYNKELFDEAGVEYPSAETPMTFDEFLEMCQKLTKKDESGKIVQYGTGPVWWEGFLWSNGGDFLNETKTEFIMNEPDAVEAMQYSADLINKYQVSPDSKATTDMTADQMFSTGKIATIGGGRWMVPTYRKLDFDWDVAPLPTGKLNTWSGWSGSVGYAIYKNTKHPEEAFKLVQFLAGEEGQRLGTELGFQIPTFKSMSNTDLFLQPGQKPEHAEVFIKAAEYERPGSWTLTANGKWLDIFNQRAADFWEGKTTAEEALNNMKPEVDKALKEGNPALFE